MLILTNDKRVIVNIDNVSKLQVEKIGTDEYRDDYGIKVTLPEEKRTIAIFRTEERAKEMMEKIVNQYEKGHRVFKITGKGVL